MKKTTYEFLIENFKNLYEKLNSVSNRLCSLKNELDTVLKIVEREYNRKYNKTS